MAAPIPPMLNYSTVYNLLNFPPILIKFVSKSIVYKIPYFKAQYFLRLRSPLRIVICFLTWRHDSPSVARTTHILNKFPWSQKVFELLRFDCIKFFSHPEPRQLGDRFGVEDR